MCTHGFLSHVIVWFVFSSDSVNKGTSNSCLFSKPNSSQKLQSPPVEDVQRKDSGTFFLRKRVRWLTHRRSSKIPRPHMRTKHEEGGVGKSEVLAQ